MELDTQQVINELLEQNKQLTLQISLARVMISQLQAEINKLNGSAPEQQPAE